MSGFLPESMSGGELFKKISDETRVVDPLRKQVIEYGETVEIQENVHCFDFWDRNKVCENCISMRAYNDNATYVKIDYKSEKTYMVTAIPYELDDRRVVVEILKDVSDSMFYDSMSGSAFGLSGVHTLIDNMNKLAFSDSLTGLYNRRYILEKLPVDLLNAALLNQKLSVIMADLDHFKQVNDEYGHVGGDLALQKAAEVISGCVKRGSDWVSRFGGEEFLICMPGADLETARRAAESMREALERTSVQSAGKTFTVTASFGVCTMEATGEAGVDDWIRQADDKLYLAKHNGRNRVEI